MIKKTSVVFFFSSMKEDFTVAAPLLNMTKTGVHWMLHAIKNWIVAVRMGFLRKTPLRVRESQRKSNETNQPRPTLKKINSK